MRACMRAGFKDLHSFAFLGGSGRIGTAQDGIFAYVPAGPHKQLDMFLHAYDCYKRGRLQVPVLSACQQAEPASPSGPVLQSIARKAMAGCACCPVTSV